MNRTATDNKEPRAEVSVSVIAPFIEKHPDLASRIGNLSIRDFRKVCELEGIMVDQIPGFKLSGFIYWLQGRAFIALREYDPSVAFHELGHYFGFEDEERADEFAELCTGEVKIRGENGRSFLLL